MEQAPSLWVVSHDRQPQQSEGFHRSEPLNNQTKERKGKEIRNMYPRRIPVGTPHHSRPRRGLLWSDAFPPISKQKKGLRAHSCPAATTLLETVNLALKRKGQKSGHLHSALCQGTRSCVVTLRSVSRGTLLGLCFPPRRTPAARCAAMRSFFAPSVFQRSLLGGTHGGRIPCPADSGQRTLVFRGDELVVAGAMPKRNYSCKSQRDTEFAKV